MSINRTEKTFIAKFIESERNVLLELLNTTDEPLKCVDILTVFLRDEEAPGNSPSRANIKFQTIKSIQPKEKVVVSHRTWIDGKPSEPHQDKMERLQMRDGSLKPYVLDISWADVDGKSQYQRIPVGH